jgi:hypothetical protein
MLNRAIKSHQGWVDKVLLITGGYVAGTSLTGAPLMVAVYMRNVSRERLRDSLFTLWFILVTIKMTTFIALSVDLHFVEALSLIPVAAIGHVVGLKAHDRITRNEQVFKRWVGGGLVVVSVFGLWNLYEANDGRDVSITVPVARQVSQPVVLTSLLLRRHNSTQ